MILALKVSNKEQSVLKLQDTLSKFNSKIKTRIGFNKGECGIIILELEQKGGCCCSEEKTDIETALEQIENVEVKRICFKK